MNITRREIIKKWKYSQTSLIIDDKGIKFIEKIVTEKKSNEVEIYDKILNPLKIEHIPIIDIFYYQDKSIIILKCIDGITCSESPIADYLYFAAKKIGNLYLKSVNKINKLDKNIYEKYYLSRHKMNTHIDALSQLYNIKGFYYVIDNIYNKYEKRPCFINHYDMHLKNFIITANEFFLCDWATMQITPFYTDLYQLLYEELKEVNADLNKIISVYKKSSNINSIERIEIVEAGICWSITVIHWLLDLIGSDNVVFKEWADNQYVILEKLIDEYNNII